MFTLTCTYNPVAKEDTPSIEISVSMDGFELSHLNIFSFLKEDVEKTLDNTKKKLCINFGGNNGSLYVKLINNVFSTTFSDFSSHTSGSSYTTYHLSHDENQQFYDKLKEFSDNF